MGRLKLSNAEQQIFNKVTSLSISFALLITSVISPARASIIAETPRSQAESALLKQLTPPAELGTVVDAHVANAQAPVVVQLQDLHANYGVQVNIAKTLEFLDSRLGAGNYKVAVEGAEGPVFVTEFAKLTDRKFKADVCDKLMKQAELTGTEYFSIVSGQPDLLWGVENEHYHEANVTLFQKTYQGKQDIARLLKNLQNDLLPIKEKYYSRAMRKLDKEAVAYTAGKIDIADYNSDLVNKAVKLGINVNARYPEIAKWTSNAKMDPYANIDKLMTEQTDLFNELQAGLAKTEVQRNISSTANELDVLYRLMVEEVTTEEVRHFAPQMAAVLGRTKYLLDATGLPYDKANLAELASASMDFYAMALLRDKYLAENTLALLGKGNREQGTGNRINPKNKSLLSPVTSPLSTVVLVAGGFHTPGISQILKDKGVSYITIAPMVTDHTGEDKRLYVERLMDRHASLAEILHGNNALSFFLNGKGKVTNDVYAFVGDPKSGPFATWIRELGNKVFDRIGGPSTEKELQRGGPARSRYVNERATYKTIETALKASKLDDTLVGMNLHRANRSIKDGDYDYANVIMRDSWSLLEKAFRGEPVDRKFYDLQLHGKKSKENPVAIHSLGQLNAAIQISILINSALSDDHKKSQSGVKSEQMPSPKKSVVLQNPVEAAIAAAKVKADRRQYDQAAQLSMFLSNALTHAQSSRRSFNWVLSVLQQMFPSAQASTFTEDDIENTLQQINHDLGIYIMNINSQGGYPIRPTSQLSRMILGRFNDSIFRESDYYFGSRIPQLDERRQTLKGLRSDLKSDHWREKFYGHPNEFQASTALVLMDEWLEPALKAAKSVEKQKARQAQRNERISLGNTTRGRSQRGGPAQNNPQNPTDAALHDAKEAFDSGYLGKAELLLRFVLDDLNFQRSRNVSTPKMEDIKPKVDYINTLREKVSAALEEQGIPPLAGTHISEEFLREANRAIFLGEFENARGILQRLESELQNKESLWISLDEKNPKDPLVITRPSQLVYTRIVSSWLNEALQAAESTGSTAVQTSGNANPQNPIDAALQYAKGNLKKLPQIAELIANFLTNDFLTPDQSPEYFSQKWRGAFPLATAKFSQVNMQSAISQIDILSRDASNAFKDLNQPKLIPTDVGHALTEVNRLITQGEYEIAEINLKRLQRQLRIAINTGRLGSSISGANEQMTDPAQLESAIALTELLKKALHSLRSAGPAGSTHRSYRPLSQKGEYIPSILLPMIQLLERLIGWNDENSFWGRYRLNNQIDEIQRAFKEVDRLLDLDTKGELKGAAAIRTLSSVYQNKLSAILQSPSQRRQRLNELIQEGLSRDISGTAGVITVETFPDGHVLALLLTATVQSNKSGLPARAVEASSPKNSIDAVLQDAEGALSDRPHAPSEVVPAVVAPAPHGKEFSEVAAVLKSFIVDKRVDASDVPLAESTLRTMEEMIRINNFPLPSSIDVNKSRYTVFNQVLARALELTHIQVLLDAVNVSRPGSSKNPAASTPWIAVALGVVLGTLAVGLSSPWALALLIPALLEFREGYQGVKRNMLVKGMTMGRAIMSPAAYENENIAKLLPQYRALALHEYGHQRSIFKEFGDIIARLTGPLSGVLGEVVNFFVKHFVAVRGSISHVYLWVRNGFHREFTAEESRLSVALAQRLLVSPLQIIKLADDVSAAAMQAFEKDAAARKALIEERKRLLQGRFATSA